MNKFMTHHEVFMHKALEDPATDLDWLLSYHKSWIQFLQHERLVHLLVTLVLSLLFVIIFGISLFLPNPYFFILFTVLAVLLGFYVFHYYKLENGVQRWYSIYEELMININKKKQASTF